MYAWPFLVARARAAEYQVVVAPEWAVDAGSHDVLGVAAGASPAPPGTVTVRDLSGDSMGPPGGVWSIAYRVSLPTAAEYGLGDADSLRDISGRPIRLVEGLVLPHSADEVAARGLDEADLRHLRAVLVPAYRSFWSADSRQPAISSDRLDLVSDQPQHRVPLELEGPYVLPTGLATAPPADAKESLLWANPDGALPPKLGIAVLVLLAASGLFWLWAHRQDPLKQTLAKVCSAVDDSDASRVYASTTSAFKEQVSEQEFARQTFGEGADRVRDRCTYEVKSHSGSMAKAKLTVLRDGETQWSVRLVQQGSSWLVSDFTLPDGARLPPNGGTPST